MTLFCVFTVAGEYPPDAGALRRGELIRRGAAVYQLKLETMSHSLLVAPSAPSTFTVHINLKMKRMMRLLHSGGCALGPTTLHILTQLSWKCRKLPSTPLPLCDFTLKKKIAKTNEWNKENP